MNQKIDLTDLELYPNILNSRGEDIQLVRQPMSNSKHKLLK